MKRQWVFCTAMAAFICCALASISLAKSWNIETVDSLGNAGQYSSLALDASGDPHIAYYEAGHNDLKYATLSGSTWQIETVCSGVGGQYGSLALDSSARPRIAYGDTTDSDLKYVAFDGSSWQKTTIESIDTMGAQYISLALDSSGMPHVSYFHAESQDLKYATFNGSSWNVQTVDSAGHVGLYTSLAFDPSGKPTIVYNDGTNNDLKYARWDGSSWIKQVIDSNGGSFISHTVDASGKVHISYHDYSAVELKYATFEVTDGGSDTHIEVLDDYGYNTSIVLDASGNPCISYTGNNELRYASFDGLSWQIEEVDGEAWAAYTSLALDAAGNAHISYYDSRAPTQDLRYAFTPEPATLLLLGFGAMGLLSRRRARQARAAVQDRAIP